MLHSFTYLWEVGITLFNHAYFQSFKGPNEGKIMVSSMIVFCLYTIKRLNIIILWI